MGFLLRTFERTPVFVFSGNRSGLFVQEQERGLILTGGGCKVGVATIYFISLSSSWEIWVAK